MTDWKKIAAALDPPIPAADVEKIAPVLEALEEAFRPLAELHSARRGHVDRTGGRGMTILEAAAALRAKKISSRRADRDIAEADRARANPKLNAFITVIEDSARARAAAMDAELASGIDRGPLHGIPFAHKDLVQTKGVRTTAGSKIFADFVPDARCRGGREAQ